MVKRLGIIGISPGNGHPYSWAAICNGYDSKEMANCPFPVIPVYLEEQHWPNAQLEDTRVTHIWTQDMESSVNISKTSFIPNICTELTDMIGAVDGVLLARDDAERHLELSEPFLRAGLPIYIDKPFALSTQQAKEMFDLQKYPGQIFTCSSFRYSKELLLNMDEKRQLGEIQYIEAQTPKYWNTYAVHLLDPIIQNVPSRGALKNVTVQQKKPVHKCNIKWESVHCSLTAYNKYQKSLMFTYFGDSGQITKEFSQSFQPFKESIQQFVNSMTTKKNTIPQDETMEIVEILEKGL
ncbi:Gfo/Idh/MocA family oxidoreductase [Verrucomicrobia bacterium]|nr:Gfo/Idh/MocA family oxidoreductase [Verrucomicrobiota bacterium]